MQGGRTHFAITRFKIELSSINFVTGTIHYTFSPLVRRTESLGQLTSVLAPLTCFSYHDSITVHRMNGLRACLRSDSLTRVALYAAYHFTINARERATVIDTLKCWQ